MTAPSRRFLGRDISFGSRRRVFEIPGGLEVDEDTFTEIEQTRVYFDDVLALTYHRCVGVAYMLVAGVCLGMAALVSLGIGLASQDGTTGLIVFFMSGFPFLAVMTIRAVFGVDVITVYGRRTKARIRFGFRKDRARRIFEDLTAKIRARQEEIAASQPAPKPPPDAGLPLPPAS